MIFEKIILKNYRQFHSVEINLPYQDDKHFVVIQGANGCGKTNILNAIYWCLYGEEIDITDKNKGKPIVNDHIWNMTSAGKSVTVEVELYMVDDYNRKLSDERQTR